MKCCICEKELNKGDKAFIAYEVGYAGVLCYSKLFCSQECAKANGMSGAKEIIIKNSDEEYKNKIEKLKITMEEIGCSFPKDIVGKDSFTDMETSNNSIIIAELQR